MRLLLLVTFVLFAEGRQHFLTQGCSNKKNWWKRFSLLERTNGTCTWKSWTGAAYCLWQRKWEDLYELEYECEDFQWVLEDSKNNEITIHSLEANKRLCEKTQCCDCMPTKTGREHGRTDRKLKMCEYYVHKNCFLEISTASAVAGNGTQVSYNPVAEETLIVETIINTTYSNTSKEVVQNLNAIEKDLRVIALNVSKTNQTAHSALGFTMASVSRSSWTQNSGVTLNIGETQVRMKSDGYSTGSCMYAAQVDLPEKPMLYLIPPEQRYVATGGSKHEVTTLLPDGPFISAGGVNVGGGKSNSTTSIDFTFRLDHMDDDNRQPSLGKMKTRYKFGVLEFGQEMVTNVKPVCSFVDPAKAWFSQVGCYNLLSADGKNITCFCNHTTMFAVLLTMSVVDIPASVQIISFVTESISILCLLITLCILGSLRRSLKSDRTSVQINLCIALLVMHISLLLQNVAVKNSRTCELATVVIHYFLLASGAWMSVEGIFLLMITSERTLQLQTKQRKAILKLKYLLGWGIPGLIVAIATIAGFVTDTYMDVSDAHASFAVYPRLPKYNFCWLSTQSNLRIPAVLLPLAVSSLFNFVVAIKVSFFVAKKREEERNYVPQSQQCSPFAFGKVDLDEVVAATKALCMLIPALGIPWIFAFLAGSEDRLASEIFMYLNACFTGLQGFMLFLVYCIFNSTVRKLVKRRFQVTCLK